MTTEAQNEAKEAPNNLSELEQEEQAFQREMLGETVTDQPADNQPAQQPEESKHEELTEEQQPEPELIPGYTASKLQEVLAEIPRLKQSLEKTNGTYGNQLQVIQSTLAGLQSRKPGFSVKKLERTSKDFPELAEALFEDLANLTGDTQAFSAFEAKLQELKAEQEQKHIQTSMAMLSYLHPDWKDTAAFTKNEFGIVSWKNPAFGNWVSSQPEDIQKEIMTGTDAFVLAQHITNFKNTTNPQQQSKPTASKTAKLAAAIPLKSSATTGKKVMSEAEEEEAAFLAEMRNPLY